MNVAVLGLGGMGRAIAERLLDRGFDVAVWNRTPARAEHVAARGARVGATPADAARGADAVLTVLADPQAVRAVVGGPDGAFAGMAPGTLLCDLTTVDPPAACAVAAAAAGAGMRFVEAPVYGSVDPARAGQLVVLAGGEAADVAALAPVLAAIGKRTIHAGPIGAGAALKLAVNLTGGHVITGIAAGLLLARNAGVDGAVFLDALGAGAFASPLVEIKGRKMLAGDYAPAFSLDLMRKDVRLIRETARRLGVATPTADAIGAVLEHGHAQGLGALDLAAVYRALETLPVEE